MSKAAQTLREWLGSGKHLPDFLKDFHDQKDVFKLIWRRREAALTERKEKDPYFEDGLDGVNWMSAQVFVIDFFLWFAAIHGYTLQRARTRLDFVSLEESIKEMKDEDAEAFRRALEIEKAKHVNT
jgi:hypothetical protein